MEVAALGVALALGTALAYVAQRGGYCFGLAVCRATRGVDYSRLHTYLVAVGVQALLLPGLLAGELAVVRWPPLRLLAIAVGAVIFGLAMRPADGCTTSVWYKAGAGDVGALAAAAGLVVGVGVGRLGILAPAVDVLATPAWAPAPPSGLAVALLLGGAVLCALLWRSGLPRPVVRTGLGLAAVALAGRALTGFLAHPVDLSPIPGAVSLSTAAQGGGVDGVALATLAGLTLGGTLGAWRGGSLGVRRVPLGVAATRFGGGVGLGLGALLAGGCSAGHGLMGVPVLAPASLLAVGLIALARAAVSRR